MDQKIAYYAKQPYHPKLCFEQSPGASSRLQPSERISKYCKKVP